MRVRRSNFGALGWGFLIAISLAGRADSRADGYHAGVLSTSSPEQWSQQVARRMTAAVPDLKKHYDSVVQNPVTSDLRAGRTIDDLKNLGTSRGSAAAPRTPPRPAPARPAQARPAAAAGGVIQTEMTAQQRALISREAQECLTILANMNQENIIPREFPSFQLARIPQYRAAAKELLAMTGTVGADALVANVQRALMGQTNSGMTPHPDYHKDLLDLLKESAANGHLTHDNLSKLKIAASGMKTGEQLALATELRDLIPELEDFGLGTLLTWADEAPSVARKNALYNKIDRWIGTATLGELIDARKILADAKSAKSAAATRQKINGTLKNRIPGAGLADLLKAFHPDADLDMLLLRAAAEQLLERLREASVIELLEIVDRHPDQRVCDSAAKELAQRSPRYAEVQGQIAAIRQIAGSQNRAAAEAARRQLVNAFLRAPISHCLYWCGQKDEQLSNLIWQQLDVRIAHARTSAPSRLAGYRKIALAVMSHKDASASMRFAALDLMARFKDRETAGQLIEVLPALPREYWPKAGSTLEALTGQDFGPRAGDGLAEMTVAIKKWRAWRQQNGGP